MEIIKQYKDYGTPEVQNWTFNDSNLSEPNENSYFVNEILSNAYLHGIIGSEKFNELDVELLNAEARKLYEIEKP